MSFWVKLLISIVIAAGLAVIGIGSGMVLRDPMFWEWLLSPNGFAGLGLLLLFLCFLGSIRPRRWM